VSSTQIEELSCKDRVEEELKDRVEVIRRLWDLYCAGEEEEDPEGYGTFLEFGLSFDYVAPGTFGEEQKEGYFRYQLSWGGPSDEFRFFCGPGFVPYRIEYWFLDWFDGAHRVLSSSDEVLLLEVFDFFDEVGSTVAEYEKSSEE